MLETIWFILWGVLWAVYFVLDGFDLGCGMLLPFVAKDEQDKNIIYKAIGPFWDGNEVWLITAGGVTFAAFPNTYAVMFSAFYSPLMIILFALILRGVSIEFRNKSDNPQWKQTWDICLSVSSLLVALLLGVAFANIFMGIPIDIEGNYQGTILTLLSPYGLLGGVLFVALFISHAAIWLSIKSSGTFQTKMFQAAELLWIVELVMAVVFLVATAFMTGLYNNYMDNPILFIIPGIAVICLLLQRYLLQQKLFWKTWFASAATIFFAIMFTIIGLYPNMFPSSLNKFYSLTIYNSASSTMTLQIMLTVVLIFIPIVIAYQIWAYYLFKGPVTEEDAY